MASQPELAFDHPVFGEATEGHFVGLSHGATHYVMRKPESTAGPDKYVFCGHGLGGNAKDYSFLTDALVARGYTVVTYDYFGRGWSRIDSDMSEPPFDSELYFRQAWELWNKLGLRDTPFLWIGYSTGGAVGTLLAARKPHLVLGMILIAPAIHRGITRPNKLVQGVALNCCCCCDCGGKAYKRTSSRFWWDSKSEAAKRGSTRVMQSLKQYPAYMRAIQKTMLGMLSQSSLAKIETQFSEVKAPILMIWGRDDETVPYRVAGACLKLQPTATLVTIEKAKHGVLTERSDEVQQHVMKWMTTYEEMPPRPAPPADSSSASSPSSAVAASSASPTTTPNPLSDVPVLR